MSFNTIYEQFGLLFSVIIGLIVCSSLLEGEIIGNGICHSQHKETAFLFHSHEKRQKKKKKKSELFLNLRPNSHLLLIPEQIGALQRPCIQEVPKWEFVLNQCTLGN